LQRVLIVTKFVPTGRPFGGMIRTVRLAEALRQRFEVRIVGFVEDGTPAIRGKLPSALAALATGSAYQVKRYDTREMRRLIAEELDSFQPDAVHVDYTQVAPLCWDVDLPMALDLHNVESALAASYADSSSGPGSWLARRDARKLEKLEAAAAERFPLITVPSAKEAQRMPGNVHVISNGVDPSRVPIDVQPERRLGAFVGTMSWLPNVDGAEWLVSEVLPLLPPDFRVELIGRTPDRRVQALAGPNVLVTGEVPDTWPYVARASVVLAPLLAPGGTRHKILEGLLAARPVVATPQAADGLEDLEGRGLVLAADPASFAREVLDLADDPDRASALGRTGRQAVIDGYAWERIGQRLLDLYDEFLGMR
jgi:polysaccharide biosynthesis protein PslH